MADIELVIKVPEELYNFLKSGYFINDGTRSGKTILQHFCRAIYNGKPLSEGHGRLIDTNEITAFRELECNGQNVESLDEFTTIIEADKENEE